MSRFDAQALIDSGERVICGGCGLLILTTLDRCRQCGHANPALRRPAATTRSGRPRSADAHTSDAVVTEAGLGGMASRRDGVLWLVSLGHPKPQGSMLPTPGGKLRASDRSMHRWRDTITGDALREVGLRWQPIDGPVQIDVAFTLPFPKNFEDQSSRITAVHDGGLPRIPAMQAPDGDKLLRAVQDALSPRDPGNQKGRVQSLANRFKLIHDDSRVVFGAEAKSYVRPGHTHAWALERPGAVIRISMIDVDVDPMPRPTLGSPGELPAPAAELYQRVSRRAG